MKPAALLLLLFATGAAVAAPTPPASSAAQAYVQGRLALADDDLDLAAQRFAEALEAGADDRLQRRALDVALLAGDMKAAVRLANLIELPAESLAGQGLADSIVVLTRAADAIAVRDLGGYDFARAAFLAPGRMGASTPVLGTVLEAWGLAARGETARAIDLVDPARAEGIGASYYAEHRAHLLGFARRWPEASDAYAALVAGEGASVSRLRIAAAAAALEAGRKDPAYRAKAITLLGGGPPRDPLLVEARARLAASPDLDGRALGSLIERAPEGVAVLLLRMAADLGRERANGPALSFARLATVAAPRQPDGWLLSADLLARLDKPDLALAALDRMPPDPVWRAMADTRRAAIFAGQARYPEARALLARQAERPQATPEDWIRLGDVERRSGSPAAAAAAYAQALAKLEGPEGPLHAQIRFLAGSSHEQAGNWPAAEAELRRAVALQPDNAIYLNYLGYSLLDRRLLMAEARELIARAYKVAPTNGAIIDSMGWAEYILGNHAEAVRLLEQARTAEPADPTIADHLGDALWRAGRRIEARHAWAAAAALDPDEKVEALIAKKLEFGLDVALADAGTVPPR